MFQNFFCWFEFLDLDLTTQPATDREKRLTEGISRSVSRRFLSACFQTLPFSGDFRFHFCYHLCQQLFILFLAVFIDVPGSLFSVRPDRRVASFPELLVDLGDAPPYAAGLCGRGMYWEQASETLTDALLVAQFCRYPGQSSLPLYGAFHR